jgi:hypothetical protein
MQSVAVFLAFVAVATAGGLNGYASSNYVQHAHVAQPVAVAQPAFAVRAAPQLAYAAGPAPLAYAAPAQVYAKAVLPASQSSAYVNRYGIH